MFLLTALPFLGDGGGGHESKEICVTVCFCKLIVILSNIVILQVHFMEERLAHCYVLVASTFRK